MKEDRAARVDMRAAIRAIEYVLPSQVLTNDDLSKHFTDWSADKIRTKTGISERHIASTDECASDLAVAAAQHLFASGACSPDDIDYLLFCTQSPDYLLPTTACLVQDRLRLATTIGAIDINQGCSGFVYGLGLAKGLIESAQAKRVLLITADTYTKFIHPDDRSTRSLFGDAAAATLVEAVADEGTEYLGPFLYGTDGRGARNLIVPTGGCRQPREPDPHLMRDDNGNVRTVNNLYMDGAEIFSFALRAVPDIVSRTYALAHLTPADVDYYCFHQANGYMLEHLRKKLAIPKERFALALSDCGNTVSCTIPIALKRAKERLHAGDRVMLVGFGVGYSWAAAMVRWTTV